MKRFIVSLMAMMGVLTLSAQMTEQRETSSSHEWSSRNEIRQSQSIYDFKVKDDLEQEVSLADYKGKVLLIVNTATRCGFTPQYKELEELYEKFSKDGFEILDFPCNQFGEQAPGTIREIHQFCTVNFNINFPQFDKIEVNGANEHPLYTFLKAQKGFGGFDTNDQRGKFMDDMMRKQDADYDKKADIKWNFTKFLISRDGRVLKRYEPTDKISDIEAAIQMEVLNWGQSPAVKVEGGMIQGVPSAVSEVTVFRGIPYAAPPVGDLRWKRPQPVVKWKGVKVADTFSNICWQPGNAVGTFYGNEFYWKENTVQSEDCLYLNVWAPADAVGNPSSKLPVAFWVHGGAYFNGYGHEITMDGDAWATRGVILVTINYRLGIFGFLAHPELSAENPDGTSGNYGTYDQVAALKWVHENIAQFGGDPDNITVLGQSAGAASIKNLVSSPLSKGLIRNAIIQSGGGIGAFGNSENGQKQAEATGKSFMDKFGYNDLKAMRALPAERLLEIFKAEGMNLFRPHIDGILLTESFDDAARNQHLADANYMIGCTLDDIRPMGKQIDEFCFLRDSLDRRPAYQYLFARKLPGTHDGAFHSAELWYMFHTLDRSWRPMTEADYRLADEVMDCWTNFVKYGNPNKPGSESWKPFTLGNPYIKTFNVRYGE